MTRKHTVKAKGNEYEFRGATFQIPAAELVKAIRQSRRLHKELLDDLMKEVRRQAALLRHKRPARTHK